MGEVFGSRLHPKASLGILEVMHHSETGTVIVWSPELIMRSSSCLCCDSRSGEFPLWEPAGQVSTLLSLQALAQRSRACTKGSLQGLGGWTQSNTHEKGQPFS